MFGQAPNTGFGASTGGFGTNTNAPFGAAKPAGGAFNFGTTTSAAPPSFGATAPAFGAPASSANPSFGGGFRLLPIQQLPLDSVHLRQLLPQLLDHPLVR